MLPSRSWCFVRFKAQLFFCLPAVSSLCELEEAGGRRCRRMENERLSSQTLLRGSWTEPGLYEASWAGSPFLQAFRCIFPSKRMKRLWGALPHWELFLKVHFGPRIPDCSSRAKKGRGQLSHSYPARCSIWNPGTCVLVNWFIKMFFCRILDYRLHILWYNLHG